METTTIIVILLLLGLIGLSIWNTVNLKNLVKRPLKEDHLNDKNYWELNYKMQYMITVFTVILAVAAFLGYNTIDNVRDTVRNEFQSKLDSTKADMALISTQIGDSKRTLASNDSVLNSLQNMLLGLTSRTEAVSHTVTVSDKALTDFKNRIAEINRKNIIQQSIYIVDNIKFGSKELEADGIKKIKFEDLTTISGDKLPDFRKPPFIIALSNDGANFLVKNASTKGFELQVYISSTPGTDFAATLFITENP